MIPARAEITIKINELPTDVKVNGKDSIFEVSDEEMTYRVICKTKSLNKVTKSIQEFQYPFVIAISGKMLKNLNKGLMVVEQAGLQTFEKKPKEEVPKEETSE